MATRISVDYDEYRYTTRQSDPNDSWDRDDTAANISINGIEIITEDRYRELTVDFDIDINKSYILLWADYNTGDSFGHDGNQVEFIDLFETIEAAEAARKSLETGSGHSRKYKRENGITIETYVPWDGYFESLNSLNLDVVRVTRVR